MAWTMLARWTVPNPRFGAGATSSHAALKEAHLWVGQPSPNHRFHSMGIECYRL